MGASRRVTPWLVRGLVLSVLLVLACAPAAAPSGSSPAGKPAAAPAAQPAQQSAAQSEWDRIVEEAKKEGEVIVWGAAGTNARRFEKEAFEKAYPGIRVNLFQAPLSSERDSRFIQEYQAGVAKVDVLISGSAGANARLKSAGMLQDVRPFLRPEILDPQYWRDGKLLWVDQEEKYIFQAETAAFPPGVVHQSVGADELQSWTDLLNPKWRGKIVMTDPRQSGPGFAAANLMYWAPGIGPEFTREFYRNGVIFSADERQNLEWTNSGRTLINIYARPREIEEIKQVGGTVRVLPPLKGADGKPIASFQGSDGILFIPNLDPLPHPNATKVYVNWFYSREGQQALVDNVGTVSARTDVDMSKLPPYSIPQPGVEYMNLNHYTDTKLVQDMRDHVTQWHTPP